jgi:hypothetical protein
LTLEYMKLYVHPRKMSITLLTLLQDLSTVVLSLSNKDLPEKYQ